jgi:hypothetical protein
MACIRNVLKATLSAVAVASTIALIGCVNPIAVSKSPTTEKPAIVAEITSLVRTTIDNHDGTYSIEFPLSENGGNASIVDGRSLVNYEDTGGAFKDAIDYYQMVPVLIDATLKGSAQWPITKNIGWVKNENFDVTIKLYSRYAGQNTTGSLPHGNALWPLLLAQAARSDSTVWDQFTQDMPANGIDPESPSYPRDEDNWSGLYWDYDGETMPSPLNLAAATTLRCVQDRLRDRKQWVSLVDERGSVAADVEPSNPGAGWGN